MLVLVRSYLKEVDPKLSLSSNLQECKLCILRGICPESMQTTLGHLGPPGLMPMMVPTANCRPACQKLTGRNSSVARNPLGQRFHSSLLCHYIWKAFNIITKKFPDTPAMPGNVSEKCKSNGKIHTSGYIKGGKIAMPFPANRMLGVAFEGRNHVLSNWKFHVYSII